MTDQNDDPIIGLDLEGPRVTLDQLIEAAEAILTILRDVDTATTKRAGGAHEWVVRALAGGSAHLEVIPEPKDADVPFRVRHRVVQNVAKGMATIADRAEMPPFFSKRALEAARKLNSLVVDGGIHEVLLRVNGERIRVDRTLAKHVGDVVEGDLKTIGSIEGLLETISIHGQRYFNVYDEVTGRAMRCLFPERDQAKVSQALGKRVLVRGVLRSQRIGEFTSMKVESLETFPDPSELPTVEMMREILNHG